MNIGSNIATKMDGLTTVSAHPPVRGRRTRPDITFKQIRWQVWNDLATKDQRFTGCDRRSYSNRSDCHSYSGYPNSSYMDFILRGNLWLLKLQNGLRLQNGSRFINGDGEGKHIAIVGSLNCGKTRLAVGIATEGSFSGKKARYLTFNKLQQIGLNHEPPPPRNTKLWQWKHSQLLIIDDVTAGTTESPEQLLQALQKLGPVCEQLRKKTQSGV
jgi:hypothetical protein